MSRKPTLTALICLFCLLAACGPMTLPNGTPRATGTPTPWNFLNWPQEPWPPLTPYNTMKTDLMAISRLTGTVVGPDELLISAEAWIFTDATTDIDLVLPTAATLVEGEPLSLTADLHNGSYVTHTVRVRLSEFTDIVTFQLKIRTYWVNPTSGTVFHYLAQGYSLYARHGVNGDLEITDKVYFWVRPTPCFGCGVVTFTDTPAPRPPLTPLILPLRVSA